MIHIDRFIFLTAILYNNFGLEFFDVCYRNYCKYPPYKVPSTATHILDQSETFDSEHHEVGANYNKTAILLIAPANPELATPLFHKTPVNLSAEIFPPFRS